MESHRVVAWILRGVGAFQDGVPERATFIVFVCLDSVYPERRSLEGSRALRSWFVVEARAPGHARSCTGLPNFLS